MANVDLFIWPLSLYRLFCYPQKLWISLWSKYVQSASGRME